MRLFEFEKLIEMFTPAIEGWYDADDIQTFFFNNYGPETAKAWTNLNTQLATRLPQIQSDANLIKRYKGGDIEIVNDFLDDLAGFKCEDLQYYKKKALWKTVPTRPADIE